MDWRNSQLYMIKYHISYDKVLEFEIEVINATYNKISNIPLIVQARRMLRFNNSTGDAAFPFIDPLHAEFS